MKKGRVIKSISGDYSVFLDDKSTIVCKPKGLFRYDKISPKVGDVVVVDTKTRIIMEIEDRKNELNRPVIANVDKAFLTFSVKEPNLNLNLLDRMISVVKYNNIEIIIIFTKLDLLDDLSEFIKIRSYYEEIGYKCFSAGKGLPYFDIISEINNNVCTFAGQSGVGKSTLMNLFDGELNIKTQVISKALNRGKHTTRHVELIRIGEGWMADTPGFGNVDFEFEDLLSFSQSFEEFFLHSPECKFSKCLHLDEPNCKIKEMTKDGLILQSRYDNYQLFAAEIKDTIKNKY